ncbi:hypothetical protein [Kocuria nitroreducens]|uniref:hypothetical protein n=1 Tax=Kocuria nitroreducens TaxID=3058914 RepID=UPI0036D82E3C
MDDARASEQTAGNTSGETTEQSSGSGPGTISAQDRFESNEILSFSSHLLDNGQWDMFGEVFVPEGGLR